MKGGKGEGGMGGGEETNKFIQIRSNSIWIYIYFFFSPHNFYPR